MTEQKQLKTFYVSLVRDLIGCYLVFEADSEHAVRLYLAEQYRTKEGVWKLPWCAIYHDPSEIYEVNPVLIKATCGRIYEMDYD